MSDIIRLLPDAVANQIAAGEVIQRPASVVKELMENSIDAGASSINVRLKDAGKTYIQVVDDGHGMTENDARLCFERHATSKISEANDLFAIRTMGFRGEALASIAAISEVTLKTRSAKEEVGTQLRVSGSRVLSQEPESCPVGTNLVIRNLFFNVPARRKFLKSEQTELRHVIHEFNHVAMAYPEIEFQLIHNNTQVFHLPAANLKQRISGIFGKNSHQNLIPLESETTIVTIRGFIGKAEHAKKTYGEQYLFVNNRFMKHPYFHKAIMQAYEHILPADYYPSYFLFFEVKPDHIDINIHPTKTEIKFEDERSIWQILSAAVKEAIGKHNLSPSLDFDNEGVIDIPVLGRNQEVRPPGETINPRYNPFEQDEQQSTFQGWKNKPVDPNWQQLYQPNRNEDLTPGLGFDEKSDAQEQNGQKYMQLKNKYVLAPVKSGLMVIDQRRAHERILYEKNMESIRQNASVSQHTLFPETIELNAADYELCKELMDDITLLGFDIRDFGNNSVVVNSIPAGTQIQNCRMILEELLEQYKNMKSQLSIDQYERLARSAATAAAIPYGRQLDQKEMRELVDQLFGCSDPNHTPSGRKILNIINLEEIEKYLA